jgi:SulP family sulfate permease
MAVIKTIRKTAIADLTAGITTALVTIPDGMASAILAGVSPISGLYALMVGTPIAALTLSSQFMYVANTGALAVSVGDALGGYSGDQRLEALVVLTVLVGIFQLLLGILKLGWITNYVSNAVLTGFMTGIAFLIILGQVDEFTGAHSEYGNKILATFDIILHPSGIDWPTVAIGLVTLALILLFNRTRLSKFSMVLGMIGASALVQIFNLSSVELIQDIAEIPKGFPTPTLPGLSLIFGLIGPAMAVGLIGLIQAAGVSKSVPNTDGNFPDISRDFAGQGIANVSAGLFQGMPIGGTMGETSVNLSAGAKSRLANIFSGLLITVIVLLFGNLIQLVAMPTIAILLIVAGFESIKFDQIEDVRDTGPGPRWTMIVTFVATMILAIQVAVAVGVVLSILIYLLRSAADLRLVELVKQDDGSILEQTAPETLKSNSITVLRLYGSTYFAAAANLADALPSHQDSERVVVILQLRNQSEVGSTFIRVVERYAQQLQVTGGKLMLSGIHTRVLEQLEKTETTETITVDDIFLAEDLLGSSTVRALDAAQKWMDDETPEVVDEVQSH